MEHVWKKGYRKKNEKVCYVCHFSLLGGISWSRYSFTHCYSSREMELNAHNLDPAVLTTWKEPRVPVMHETGRFGEEKKSLPFQGNRTTIPRLPSLQCSQCRDCTVLENFDTPFMFYIILTLVLQF